MKYLRWTILYFLNCQNVKKIECFFCCLNLVNYGRENTLLRLEICWCQHCKLQYCTKGICNTQGHMSAIYTAVKLTLCQSTDIKFTKLFKNGN